VVKDPMDAAAWEAMGMEAADTKAVDSARRD